MVVKCVNAVIQGIVKVKLMMSVELNRVVIVHTRKKGTMAKRKSQSITQSPKVMFTVTPEDREALAYFERKLMMQNNVKDCTSIPDASIIRFCINLAYKYDRKLGVVTQVKKGNAFGNIREEA